ncbi:hypothetical protein PEPS_25300 [Persicobacter psychrovividus]|uniref:Uncharacterized protein n=1 Tax=Persicobacter psychrovividus TaxID=387638 RepID=A0ABM7VH21_9BACT|nr:hypothetical protein PEPS_25300 [Persicobacter psychrovividus]
MIRIGLILIHYFFVKFLELNIYNGNESTDLFF